MQLAWATSTLGEWTYRVVFMVYAYRLGGASSAALASLAQVAPAALAAPFMGTLADRYPRQRIIVVTEIGRGLVVGSAAAVLWAEGPALLVFLLAGVEASLATAFRPAQSALLPSLCSGNEQLTAANVVTGSIESVAFLAGPAIGGLLLAATSSAAVLGVMAMSFASSAGLVLGIPRPIASEEAAASPSGGRLRELTAGLRGAIAEPRLRLLLGLSGAQAMVNGALNVLIIGLALDVLDMGSSGPGLLVSAAGSGAALGALLASGLIGRRLAPGVALGLLAWGLPLVIVALSPSLGVVVAALLAMGAGDAVGVVATQTLIQRIAADDVMARVFGVLESVFLVGIGLGSLLGALLVGTTGIRGALAISGAFLTVLVLAYLRPLVRLDAGLDVSVAVQSASPGVATGDSASSQ